MDTRKHHFHHGTTGAAITVRVSPRANRNEVTDVMTDGTIKIRLTAPPVEGQANAALIHFLADLLGVSATKIEIVAGQTGKEKLVAISGLDPQTVQDKILAAIPK